MPGFSAVIVDAHSDWLLVISISFALEFELIVIYGLGLFGVGIH
jgi:hypothetical protein